MLNQAALDSTSYVESYLDCIENLPDDLQRQISRMRELDISYQAFMKEVELHRDVLGKDDSMTSRKALRRVQTALINAQEVGDEKMQLVQNIVDIIENRSRQLEYDCKRLLCLADGKEEKNDYTKEVQREGHSKDIENHSSNNDRTLRGGDKSNEDKDKNDKSSERLNKRPRRSRVENDDSSVISDQVTPLPRASATLNTKKTNMTKKKKRKSKQTQQREETPPREDDIVGIDPNEPTYCLCVQVSFGEMIGCDNDLCPIEWFHFACVGLVTKPKGKWYCPKCRGDRQSVMKPKALFLKELERYNKEKEEKL